jgi:hypothetical protein
MNHRDDVLNIREMEPGIINLTLIAHDSSERDLRRMGMDQKVIEGVIPNDNTGTIQHSKYSFHLLKEDHSSGAVVNAIRLK